MGAGVHGGTVTTRLARRTIIAAAVALAVAASPQPARADGAFSPLTTPTAGLTSGAGRVAVSLPIWESRYGWSAGDGYAGWGAVRSGPDPDGYGTATALGGNAGLWLWLTGDREYRPGHAEWSFQAPGTTRIASADLTLSYADKLFAHHCLDVGLRAASERRSGERTCAPPALPATQQRYDVMLSDPSDRPTTKEAYVRVEMPQCKNPRDTACSKWIPALDPLKNGAFVRVGSVDMVLVDDDLPVPVPSGPFRELDDRYVDGRATYRLDVAASDAGAGIRRVSAEHLGHGILGAADAPCDGRHLTPSLGGRVCPAATQDDFTIDTTSMAEGRQDFDVTAEDPAANVGRSAAWSVKVDRTAPSAPADIGFDYDEDDGTVTAFWDSGDDPALVDGTPGSGHARDEFRVRRGASDADPGTYTEWAPSSGTGVELPDGKLGERFEIEVRSVDAVGNVSAGAGEVYVVDVPAVNTCDDSDPAHPVCPTDDGVIVRLSADADAADLERLQRRAGSLRDVDEYRSFPAFSAKVDPSQVDELAADPQVESVEPNRLIEPSIASASRDFGVTDARPDFGVNGDANGDLDGYSASEPTIAVLDSGIDDRHRDLDGGKIVGWFDAVNGTTDPYDTFGHGTHVASIAAGAGDSDSRYRGVAYGAPLYGIKVFPDVPRGQLPRASVEDILEGIDHAILARREFTEPGDQFPGIPSVNIRVLNMSIGGAPQDTDGRDTFAEAIARAQDEGILTVAAAGNSGPNFGTVGSPGTSPAALTVANMADVGVLGFYLNRSSSRGPSRNPDITGIKPDVAAPGTKISAAFPCSSSVHENERCSARATMTGTSMATPFVAGVATLMLDENPNLTPQQIRETIEATARDWGPLGDDFDYGLGRLDGYEAIDAVSKQSGTGPSVGTHTRGTHELTRADERHEVEFTAREGTPIAITLLKTGGQANARVSLGLWRGDCGDTEVKRPRSTTGRQLTMTNRPSRSGSYCARITGDITDPTTVAWDISRKTS